MLLKIEVINLAETKWQLFKGTHLTPEAKWGGSA